jgi:hypothetical protein
MPLSPRILCVSGSEVNLERASTVGFIVWMLGLALLAYGTGRRGDGRALG